MHIFRCFSRKRVACAVLFFTFFLLFNCLTNACFCQSKKLVYQEKDFQLSLFPGVSTNGLYSADYFNRFSINLTSGLSAGNYLFELAVISNLNIRSVSGIQVAGLANIVGSNSFVNLTNSEEKLLRKEGVTAELRGFQFSGFLNFVREDVTGAQFTGGFNINQKNVSALQIAGFGNLSRGNVIGMQVSGLANIALKSMSGFQVSLLMNLTEGSLVGTQVGFFNKTRRIAGKKSRIPTADTGFQIGIINAGGSMDGVQLGLINMGGKTRGIQVGLVNIFRPGPYSGGVSSEYGVPIGLLNFGSRGNHLRLYTTDLFAVNVEYTTGNCQNCSYTESQMPVSGRFKKFNQNALIYGRNLLGDFNNNFSWGVGYGFEKVLLNKSSMNKGDGKNNRLQISYGLRWLHLNKSNELQRKLNFLTRAHSEFAIKMLGIRWFVGIAINYYVTESEDFSVKRAIRFISGDKKHQIWGGYSFGIQL